jgi:hypothetical protein
VHSIERSYSHSGISLSALTCSFLRRQVSFLRVLGSKDLLIDGQP